MSIDAKRVAFIDPLRNRLTDARFVPLILRYARSNLPPHRSRRRDRRRRRRIRVGSRLWRGDLSRALRRMSRPDEPAYSAEGRAAKNAGGPHPARARLRRDDERRISAPARRARRGREVSRDRRWRSGAARLGILRGANSSLVRVRRGGQAALERLESWELEYTISGRVECRIDDR